MAGDEPDLEPLLLLDISQSLEESASLGGPNLSNIKCCKNFKLPRGLGYTV